MDRAECRRLIALADAAIVRPDPESHVMPPLDEQIRHLKPEAGPLKCILSKDQVVVANFAEYEKRDCCAGDWQTDFRSAYRKIFLFVLVAIVGSVVLLTAPLRESVEFGLLPLFMLMISFALLYSLLLTRGIAKHGHYTKWHTHRAHAEHARRMHFVHVFDATPEQSGDEPIPPLVLKLEYFRKYQIQLQLRYFYNRGLQSKTKADRIHAILVPCLWLAIAWVGLQTLAVLAAIPEQGYTVWGLLDWLAPFQTIELWGIESLGLIITLALSVSYALLLAVSRLDDNVRNAARYDTMEENLTTLVEGGRELKQAQQAACDGDRAAVMRFVDLVHSVMAAELADWVRLGDLETGKDRTTTQLDAAPAQSSTS